VFLKIYSHLHLYFPRVRISLSFITRILIAL
jgi:hypothetical protein